MVNALYRADNQLSHLIIMANNFSNNSLILKQFPSFQLKLLQTTRLNDIRIVLSKKKLSKHGINKAHYYNNNQLSDTRDTTVRSSG